MLHLLKGPDKGHTTDRKKEKKPCTWRDSNPWPLELSWALPLCYNRRPFIFDQALSFSQSLVQKLFPLLGLSINPLFFKFFKKIRSAPFELCSFKLKSRCHPNIPRQAFLLPFAGSFCWRRGTCCWRWKRRTSKPTRTCPTRRDWTRLQPKVLGFFVELRWMGAIIHRW